MKKSRFAEEQIIGFIRQGDAGMPVKELCREGGFSDATFCKWRAKYGGMDVPDAAIVRAWSRCPCAFRQRAKPGAGVSGEGGRLIPKTGRGSDYRSGRVRPGASRYARPTEWLHLAGADLFLDQR